ncbi:DUF6522 family protein [Afifella pfennigii]|uniref:DUF6522 family protein n=1 Tax=Afifella pfennigii TaxID=209897 RepID=UPI00068D9E65|nr:DUF6522 family protein [Afifella pfennigii]
MSAVTVNADGFVVPAELIARAFRLDPASVPQLMREGIITSRCEEGIAADAGRFRLTFFHAGRALRLIVDKDGRILSETRHALRSPQAAKD